MRELYVNGVYVRYKTDAELERALALAVKRAHWHRHQTRLEELSKQRRKFRQLHEPPNESCFAL